MYKKCTSELSVEFWIQSSRRRKSAMVNGPMLERPTCTSYFTSLTSLSIAAFMLLHTLLPPRTCTCKLPPDIIATQNIPVSAQCVGRKSWHRTSIRGARLERWQKKKEKENETESVCLIIALHYMQWALSSALKGLHKTFIERSLNVGRNLSAVKVVKVVKVTEREGKRDLPQLPLLLRP